MSKSLVLQMPTAYTLTSCAYLSVYTSSVTDTLLYSSVGYYRNIVCIVFVNIFLKGKNIEKYFSPSELCNKKEFKDLKLDNAHVQICIYRF